MSASEISVEVEPRMVRAGEPVECGFVNFMDGDRLIIRFPFTREAGINPRFGDGTPIAPFYLDLAYKALDDAGLDIPRPSAV